MSLAQEFIPALEVPLGEQAKISWNLADLKTQLNVTISSIAWSVEDATILSLGTPSDSGDVFSVPVTADLVGCSHVIADITTSDSDQNPTKLFIKIFVIDPMCRGI